MIENQAGLHKLMFLTQLLTICKTLGEGFKTKSSSSFKNLLRERVIFTIWRVHWFTWNFIFFLVALYV